MSFIFGGVLWASAAVAAPVVIHLLLRTRPRTVTLPTMHFVRKTHRSGASRHRLKHLLLLGLRMLALLLMVLIVARAFVPAFSSTRDGAPTAIVVVVDNSASMGYRFRGQTLLQRGKDEAAMILHTLADGSQAAVLTADGRGGYGAFTSELAFAVEQVQDVPPGYGDASLGAAVEQAMAMLENATQPHREVLVMTDNTARAWAALPSAATDAIRVTVINLGVEQHANLALGPVQQSATTLPQGVPVTLRTTVGGEHTGGDVLLDVLLEGQQQRRRISTVPGQRQQVEVSLEPSRWGTRHGQLRLAADDPLLADNVRYFTIEVAPPATVLVVSSPAPQDPTAALMAGAVAPPLAGEQTGLQRRRLAAEALEAADLVDVSLLLLANVTDLLDEQWQAIENFVRGGGAVWIVPGSLSNVAAWNTLAAQKVLPARIEARRTLNPPRRPAEPQTTHPMLKGFDDPLNPPLNDVNIYQRLALGELDEGAAVVLADSAGEPLVVVRGLGSGRVVLWTTSPARAWSDLGPLGGQLVVLARDTTHALLGESQRPRSYPWGSDVLLPLPPGVDGPLVSVSVPGQDEPRIIEANLRRGFVPIQTDRLGAYTASFARGQATLTRGFSVNVPVDESDLRRADPRRLEEAFGESLHIARSADERAEQLGRGEAPLDLLPLLFVALLATLVGESFFANRFYKTPPDV
jgi:hypothetical protein